MKTKIIYLIMLLSLSVIAQDLQVTAPVVGVPYPKDSQLACKISFHSQQPFETVNVVYSSDKNSKATVTMELYQRTVDYPTSPPYTAELTGLEHNQHYSYQIIADEQVIFQGTFQTPNNVAESFSVALASCIKYQEDQVQDGWQHLMSLEPDFSVLLGDNVYADSTDHTVLWKRHREQRSVAHFKKVLLRQNIAAIWDDHDFGPDNANGTVVGKEHSLRCFKEVWWTNPSHGISGIPGVFYKFSWNGVHFFVLDGRYQRSKIFTSNPTMLGEKQLEWLLAALKQQQREDERNNTQSFKVLLSGSVLTDNPLDGWFVYPKERCEMFRRIMEEGISGVVYAAGDVHCSYLRKHGVSGGYPIHEVISSGIANDHFLFGYTKSFATMKFDLSSSNWQDHAVELQIHGQQDFLEREGARTETRRVKLQDLTVPPTFLSSQAKFLYDPASKEYIERQRENNLVDKYSAPFDK